LVNPFSGLTSRLRLVPVGPAQAADLYALHQDPGIARWYGPWTEREAHERAAAMGEAWRTEGVHKWLAYDRETDALVGRGGLSWQEIEGVRRLELGWAVREHLWGKGYASEIGRAGLSFAFGPLDAASVVAFTEAHNERSRAVMRRLGFRYLHLMHHRGEQFVLYELHR
jgi:RimJ/RimL family protein N-acetyltransferase